MLALNAPGEELTVMDRKEIVALLDEETRNIKHLVDEESPAPPMVVAPVAAEGATV